MSRMIFETAVIQSAVQKANRVAPTRGSAFDKAAGIVLEVQPDEDYPAIIKATDTQTFHMEWLNALESGGPAETWRLPAEPLDLILQKMPVGSGCQVTMERVPEGIKIHSGKKRGTLFLMKHDDYPTMIHFDPTDLQDAPGLIERIGQVEWAADVSGTAPLGYVLMDGKTAVATDRYRLAVTPLEFETDEPILIQARTLTRFMSKNTNPRIGTDGGLLHLMPDDHTQIKTLTYEGSYPDVSRLMIRDKPEQIRVRKKSLLDIMESAMTMAGNERFPAMDLHIGREEIAASLQNKSYGLFGDILPVPGYATHKRIMLTISPKLLMEAIQQAPDEVIVLGYDPSNLRLPLYINGGSGFEAWVALRGGEQKP